jgi:hypothetical protein
MLLNTNPEFADRFEFVSFPAVHEIAEEAVPALHEAVSQAAIVIPQRVEESYRDGVGLGTETLARIAGSATVIRWPSIFWAGYFPDLFYLRDDAGRPVVDGPFDYHDRLILEAYVERKTVDEVCRLLGDPERPSHAVAWAAETTAELELRGRDCDVEVTSFIASRFRDELLFFTMNHPANRLLGHIAQQITERAGIPGSVDASAIGNEILDFTFYPLHANHVRALELHFGKQVRAGAAPFRIRGVDYDPPRAVQAFFDYYTANPRLVEINRAPSGG